jgi:hypothetical protein
MKVKFRAKRFTEFLVFFVMTILFFRLLVLVIGDKSILLFGNEIHHFYIGVFLFSFPGIYNFSQKIKL